MAFVSNFGLSLLYNMAWPMVLLCLAVIALCIGVAFHANMRKSHNRINYGSPEWTTYTGRQFAAVQWGIGAGLIGAIFWGIPAPDFQREIVRVEVPVRVNVPGPVREVFRGERLVPSTYQDVRDRCVANFTTGGYTIDQEEATLCHNQALVASGIRVRVRLINNSYQELFRWCNERFSISAPDATASTVRNERLQICHNAAMQGANMRINQAITLAQ